MPENDSKELAIVQKPADWGVRKEMAKIMTMSGLMPKDMNNESKILTVMIAADSLRLDPWQAVQGINIIQGKPTMTPLLMLALARRSGQWGKMTVEDDGFTCIVTMTRKGEDPHIEKFTQKDAELMGLATKDNWRKQPAVMRKWRCISAAMRIVYPDIIMGASYFPEEIDPDIRVDSEGAIISMPTAPSHVFQEVLSYAEANNVTVDALKAELKAKGFSSWKPENHEAIMAVAKELVAKDMEAIVAEEVVDGE